MKKIAILLSFLVLLISAGSTTYAQCSNSCKEKTAECQNKHISFSEILKLKRSYISENLTLSDEKAKKFWPIYDRYIAEEQKNHKTFKTSLEAKGITREKIKDDSQLTEGQLSFYLSQKMQFKEQMFNADKRFYNDAKAVLSARELKKFYQLEQSFKNQCAKKRHANNGNSSNSAQPKPQQK